MPIQNMSFSGRDNRALPGTHALRLFALGVGAVAVVEAIAAREAFVALLGLLLGSVIALTAHIFAERRLTPAKNPRRWLLPAMAAIGLAVALLDLRELAAEEPALFYPIAQLGLPILAFFAAMVAGARANFLDTKAAMPQSLSLRRASTTLVACGAVTFGLAELAEHDLPSGQTSYLAAVTLIGLLLVTSLLTRGARISVRASAVEAPEAAFNTQGIRVDGRAQWVDFLEDCMSLGQRRKILAATLAAARLEPGQNLIDIGCGTGELVVAAMAIVADGRNDRRGHAMGVDATPGMIDLARRRAEDAGVEARFDVAVAEHLPVPDAVIDAVTSSFFFHHLPSAVKAEALVEMWRVLAPGGRLVITDYGQPQSLLGYLAPFPMRFNFHEYVRGQLGGEVEAVIAAANIGRPRIDRSFLGYINVLVLEKPLQSADDSDRSAAG